MGGWVGGLMCVSLPLSPSLFSPTHHTHPPTNRAIQRYEDTFEQPATEERIWRAAALYRERGEEEAQQHLQTTYPPSPYGREKRQMMGLIQALFLGEIGEEAIRGVIDAAKVGRWVGGWVGG